MTRRDSEGTRGPISPLHQHSTIHSLPDPILVDIFSRIGSSPLPSTSTPSSPPNAPSAIQLPRWAHPVLVTHPVLCALVCQHWARLAPLAVIHLSFLNATLGLRFMQQLHRFSSLRFLRFERVTVGTLAFALYAPVTGSNFLLILARNAPGLESLEFDHNAETMHREEIVTMLIPALPLWRSLRRLVLGDLLVHVPSKLAHRLMLAAKANPTLEELSLEFSWERTTVLEAFQDKLGLLKGLKTLSVCCPSLQGFRAVRFHHLSSLSVSGLEGCCQLPDVWGDLPSLERLRLFNAFSLSELPATLQLARRLTELQLEGLASLAALPDWLGELNSLQDLRVVNCQNLKTGSELRPVPDTIGMLTNLQTFHLEHCHWLAEIPDSVTELCQLEELSVAHCVVLSQLPEGLSALTGLRVLSLLGCLSLLSFPASLGDLVNLEELQLSGSPVITRLPEGFGGLHSLQFLSLWRCNGLKGLPKCIGKLKNLRSLAVEECPMFTMIPRTLTRLRRLQVLRLRRCCSLTRIPEDFSLFLQLRQIVICECPAITYAPQIPRHLIHLKAATELD